MDIPAFGIDPYALPPIRRGDWIDASDKTYTVDSSWNYRVNFVQPADGKRADFLLPAVGTIVASGAPFDFVIHNRNPRSPARCILAPNPLMNAPGQRLTDTIDGNFDEFYIAGDEKIRLVADFASGPPYANWMVHDGRPRQGRQPDGLAKYAGQAILAPGAFSPVPGLSVQLPQMLQSGSSREKVSVNVTASSTDGSDTLYATLRQQYWYLDANGVKQTATRMLGPANSGGLHSVAVARSSGAMDLSFFWIDDGGYRQAGNPAFGVPAMTLDPCVYTLCLRSNYGTIVVNPAGSEARTMVSEWAVT